MAKKIKNKKHLDEKTTMPFRSFSPLAHSSRRAENVSGGFLIGFQRHHTASKLLLAVALPLPAPSLCPWWLRHRAGKGRFSLNSLVSFSVNLSSSGDNDHHHEVALFVSLHRGILICMNRSCLTASPSFLLQLW